MIDEAVVRVVHLLDKRLEIISVLATMSPLLGLLGTTIGMIKTFFCDCYFWNWKCKGTG